ncbi:hypothetical protein [Dactylosporangium sp. NPDC051484]|uniref:hypothetical protein n=1 Tax=Dactylosporangium sp. NPDC051484 TaxID=3154942 RepID=UPI00344B7343
MDLHNLDDVTREIMISEFQQDLDTGRLYLGRRLNSRGHQRWPEILADALRCGGPASLADLIRAERLLLARETYQRNGKPYEKKVPVNAADTLAEGEFVRFYMRAVCVRAISAMMKVQVYRAKAVNDPRLESALKIGQLIDPAALLDDLRMHVGVETALGLPPGPNSGLCVRLS